MSVYNLDRYNVPLPDPNNPGFFILSGSNRIQGFESELKGYVTDQWQSWLGYAYTDARIPSATSATVVAGNRIQLVPFNQFSWWNKYQFNPVWAASLGVIYFSDSYASSDDTVVLPSFWRFDAGLFATIDETLEGTNQRREPVQQGLLGDGGRKQQHFAGPRADISPESHSDFLRLREVPEG